MLIATAILLGVVLSELASRRFDTPLVLLGPAELAALTSKAKARGSSLSAYAREVLLAEPVQEGTEKASGRPVALQTTQPVPSPTHHHRKALKRCTSKPPTPRRKPR
jgi:hypothetical protein